MDYVSELPMPMPMPFEITFYDEERLNDFYIEPNTFQSTCQLPYTAAGVPPLGGFYLPNCNIPSIEDPGHLTVPGVPEFPIYNDATADAESVFSWSTFSNFTESPQPSPRDISVSPCPQKERDDLLNYGVPTEDGSWRCTFPACNSKTTFQRGCDLRKHYKRHSRHLFCRHSGCPKSLSGGFSSKKDRARHEARHNPTITCEWEGCTRLFSRMDNMRDHLRRVHHKQTRSR